MQSISVIIPVYNRPKMIYRAIDSVLRQTLPAAEIIVVDDGSTDSTADVIRAFGNKVRLISLDQRGVSAARNRGIRAARGKWLAFLDSDDEWLPEKSENAADFISRHPQYRIFQCQEIWIRNNIRVNPRQKHKKMAGKIFKESLPLCIVSPSAVMMERSLFDEVGLFDETLPVCEDYDLWLRVLRKHPIGLDERPGLIKYGGHEDQLSHKFWGMDFYRVLAMEKHLQDKELDLSLRIAVLKEIVKKLQVLHTGSQKRGKQWKEVAEKLNTYQRELKKYS